MTKHDIVSDLCKKGYYKEQAKEILDDVVDIIREALLAGEPVTLWGFGTFDVKVRKGRPGRNVATGEPFVSEDVMLPVFRPSETLREGVKNVQKQNSEEIQDN